MHESEKAPVNPLALWFRLLGHLTGKDSRVGRLFKRAEAFGIQKAGKASQNRLLLRAAGGVQEQAYLMQSIMKANLETWLRLWRLPTSSDMTDVQDQLRRLEDRLEAMTAQLEHLVDSSDQKKP